MDVLKEIQNTKIVPVATLNDETETNNVLSALNNMGINVIEICFRNTFAKDAIKFAKEKYPHFIVGAGTIINALQAINAIELGVNFIVSPGYSDEVYEVCKKKEVLYIPGVLTPTEIMKALENGLTYLKFFPAERFGGIKTINALSSAFPMVNFMPTGGVDSSNVGEYVKNKAVFAIGSSSILKGDIEKNAAEMLKIIRG